MNTVAIIPARMGSSRFPGKPMAKINGIPMIGHVYMRTRLCERLSGTYVATCDDEIFDYITSIGGDAIMTSDTHERCSDRTAEALLMVERQTSRKNDIVVMVQGDEPMIVPEMIEEALKPFYVDASINVVNLMASIKSESEFNDPNEVKVVVDRNGKALYFSREPIPSLKKGATEISMLKQVCVIPFRRDYLIKFNEMPATRLEEIESVDMLRILEHGETVNMVMTNAMSVSVDTPEDLARVEGMMKDDVLLPVYSEFIHE